MLCFMGMREWRAAARRALACLLPLAVMAVALASCGHGGPVAPVPAHASSSAAVPSSGGRHPATARRTGTTTGAGQRTGGPLPAPAALAPFGSPTAAGEGTWHRANPQAICGPGAEGEARISRRRLG